MKELSSMAKIKVLPTVDIGGTDSATVDTTYWAEWHDMAMFDRVTGKVMLSTWNATDDLDECRLQQATDSSGSNAKDLTTDASDGDYDTDTPIDAAGNTVVLEARAEDLDRENGFRFVRLYVAEGGNTGVDNVTGVLILHGARHHRAELDGAAVSGEVVYVRPS